MKTNILFLVSACFVLSSSLQATDMHVKLKSYSKAIKKLEKHASRIIEECHTNSSCVNNGYHEFVLKREKLVKSKLHIIAKHFQRVAKKTLKTESKCVKSAPNSAGTCFKDLNEEFYLAVNSLT